VGVVLGVEPLPMLASAVEEKSEERLLELETELVVLIFLSIVLFSIGYRALFLT
jgi:hypothetical protein